MLVLVTLILAIVGSGRAELTSTEDGTTENPPTTTSEATTMAPSVDCPSGWLDADYLGCYKFLDGKVNLSWVEAQQACEVVGGYLAEPVTTRQADFLSSMASLDAGFTGIGYWYLGLTDLGHEGKWQWMHSDLQVEDSVWGTSHPRNKTGNREDCGVMVLRSDKYWWEDHDCLVPEIQHHPVAPVCQQDTTASATTVQPETTTPPGCPASWTEYQGNCYKYFTTSTSWVAAEFNCMKEDARLASVHSSAEDTFLRKLAGENKYWMGGFYVSSGEKLWSDQSVFDYENNFYNPSIGQCIYYSITNSNWNTASCTTDIYYICKKGY